MECSRVDGFVLYLAYDIIVIFYYSGAFLKSIYKSKFS